MLRLRTLWALAVIALAALGSAEKTPTTELWIIPHTHADVGWLQTVDSLSRMNVSRILNGVVGNLANDTAGRRRFVWDEMAFLQLWWDEQATAEQQQTFTQLVREGKIEFVDNGWSQHDMGCTTTDSMISNWVEGHQWLLNHFGETAQPKVGWSLDPFGMSSSQAVLQSLMGMEAWFFTRVTGSTVDSMKKSQGLEFVWRASSALPPAQSEIFSHVFESYYCMPLPTYAFEWGADKGAQVPTAANVQSLAQGLAKIAKDRQPWFRTNNVLIPWGCDYQYQNAELVYRSTDWLIDVINNNTASWGVHAQYGTPSEYLSAVKASAAVSGAKFPVKSNGTDFFPYNDWTGYYTSRSNLKGHSQRSVSKLTAAEALFALRGNLSSSPSSLWKELETARRNNGIVQHHDAITGTECSNEEGCAGTDQVVGPHDVLGNYDKMLTDAEAGSEAVISATLGAAAAGGATVSLDADALGKTLMGDGDGGDDALLIVYNPLGSERTDIVTVPVPICALDVVDADTGAAVPSQVTALFGIGDGQPPYYDFELQFEVSSVPAMGFQRFRLSPRPDGQCHGGDASSATTFVRHEQRHPTPQTAPLDDATLREALRRQGEVSGDPRRWESVLAEVRADSSANIRASGAPPSSVTLENSFLAVYIDLRYGVRAVLDKSTGRNFTLRDELVSYNTQKCKSAGDAYLFCPLGEATPLLDNNTTALASTVAIGPIMHEVRIQPSPEHKTRIRLWQSNDPDVGGRIEFAHRIGVLEPHTEIASRWLLDDMQSTDMTLYSEDNGLEKIPRTAGTGSNNIATNVFPSQMSAFIATSDDSDNDGGTQLSVALDRSHGVASLTNGTLEVIMHRRGGPFEGSGGTVVLDDTSRMFAQSWISVGNRTASNRLRVAMKQRLNHPLVLASSPFKAFGGAGLPPARGAGGIGKGLPRSLHLQSVRAASASNEKLLLRVQHMFTMGEDDELSKPQPLDPLGILETLRSFKPGALLEMTLDGMRDVSTTVNRTRFPAEGVGASGEMSTASRSNANSDDVVIEVKPFELRTFRLG